MLYIIFCVFWVLMLILVAKKRNVCDILNPVVWLVLAWSFLLGSYLFSGITYEHDINIWGWIYLSSFVVVFFFVFCGVYKSYNPKSTFLGFVSNDGKEISQERIISVRKYFFIGITGTAMYLFDFLRLNNLSDLYSLHDTFKMSIIGGIGLFLLCANSFVWLYQITCSIKSNKRIPVFSYIAVATQLIPYYLISGRQGMVIIGLELLMLFVFNLRWNKKYKYKKSIVIIILFTFISITLYFVDISTNRTTVTDMDLRYVSLEKADKVYFSDETKDIIQKSGSLAPALMTLEYYFSHQFRSFQVFIDYYSFAPLLGSYQFHYIARRLGPLDFSDYAYEAFDDMQMKSGLNYHVYRTAIAAFIVDFGWIGAYFFLGFLSMCIAKRFKSFMKNKISYNIVFQIIICTGVFFTIEYSPFSEQIWGYSFFWILLIPSVELSIQQRRIVFIRTI